ncbi:MAG: protein kinase [Planctomycetia bacterium]|nr:protein kinase [Planctomycetia bacterium]
MKMECCPSHHILHEFVFGVLDKQESVSIEEHILTCTSCANQLGTISQCDPIIETLREQWTRPAFTIPEEVQPIQRQLHAAYNQITTRVSLLHGVSTKSSLLKDYHDLPDMDGNADQSDKLMPDKIGHYVLQDKLGTGGTGEVYRAWDETLGRYVAIKIILDRRVWHSQHIERFTSEAGTLARLAHPQIVQIYEVGEEAGRAYLVLEYLPGGDLATLLRGEPQNPEDSAFLVAQLARAVHHAHSQGIIHRDLKPSNILIEKPVDAVKTLPSRLLKDLRCKIADFGLAKRMEVPGKTESGTVLGTPGYLAPENLMKHPDEATHGPASDIYSLGAILYELLTGRPPFRGETVAETLVQIQTELPLSPRKLRPGLSRELETICMHCLDKEPQRRYATALQLAEDLDRFLMHEPIMVRPANVMERAMKWARRKPALAALAIVLLASLALLTVGGISYERRLQAALLRTESERDRADSNYRSAREALERMLQKLDDPRRANVPQLQALRREQQHEIVQFLQTVTANTSNDPKIMRDVSKALYTSGRLRLVLGELEQARQDLQRSITLLRELQQQSPDDSSLRLDMAGSLQALAVTYPMGSENLRLNEEVLAIQTKVALEQPENRDIQRMLAITLHNQGSNYISLKQLDKAEEFLLKSIKVLEHISVDVNSAPQIEFAETEVNLSLVYESLKKPEQSEQFYLRALKRFESILQNDPQNIRAQISLSGLRVNRANMLASKGRNTEAMTLLDANLHDLQALLQREPEFRDVKERLFETQGTRGNILGPQKRHHEAAAAFLDVVRFADPREANYYQLFVASNWAMAGEYRLSLEACKLAGQYAGLNFEQKAYLAMTYCRNAAQIVKDTTISTAEKDKQIQQCSHQALHWLSEAKKQAGAAAWIRLKQSLSQDAMWLPIREHLPAWDWVKQS